MSIENSYRAFFLGMSDPEAERSIEEGVLEGSLPTENLLCAEDELIDDYLFGRLSPVEEEKFKSHFLLSGDRMGKLDLARALMRHASLEPTEAHPQHAVLRRLPLRWRISIITGAAAAVVALAYLGVQNLRLSTNLDEARKISNERRLIAQNNSEPPASLELFPGQARGIERVPHIQLPQGGGQISIAVHPSAQPTGKFRLVLVGDNESEIWTQEFAHPIPEIKGQIFIALPTSILIAGDYWLRLEESSKGGKFVEIETYAFRIDE